jgi:hypothetical protein
MPTADDALTARRLADGNPFSTLKAAGGGAAS